MAASCDPITHAKQRDDRANFHRICKGCSTACEFLIRLWLERLANNLLAQCHYKRVVANENDGIFQTQRRWTIEYHVWRFLPAKSGCNF